MFINLLLMMAIGYGVVSFFVLYKGKRYRRQKSEKYDSWFEEQVQQGLREEIDGKITSQNRICEIFNAHIKRNNRQN